MSSILFNLFDLFENRENTGEIGLYGNSKAIN